MGCVLPSRELFSFLRIHFTSVNTATFDSTHRLVHGPQKQAVLGISSDARRKCTPARLLTFFNYYTLIFFPHFLPPSHYSHLRFPYLLYFKVPLPSLLCLPASSGDYKQEKVYSKHVQQPSQPTRTSSFPPPSLLSCNWQGDCFYRETSGSSVSFRRRRSALPGREASTSTRVIFRCRFKKNSLLHCGSRTQRLSWGEGTGWLNHSSESLAIKLYDFAQISERSLVTSCHRIS